MYLLSEIASKINGKLVGPDIKISEISEIDKGNSGSLSFIDNPLYAKYYATTKCSALIVNIDFSNEDTRDDISLIKVSNARLALLNAINLFYKPSLNSIKIKNNSSSIVSANTVIGKNLTLGEFNYISDNSRV